MAINFVCPSCKSTNIGTEANVTWSVKDQKWVLDTVNFGTGFCADCQNFHIREFDVVEVKLDPLVDTHATIARNFVVTEEDRQTFQETYKSWCDGEWDDVFMHVYCRGEDPDKQGHSCGHWEQQPADMPVSSIKGFDHIDGYEFKCGACGTKEVAVSFHDHAAEPE